MDSVDLSYLRYLPLFTSCAFEEKMCNAFVRKRYGIELETKLHAETLIGNPSLNSLDGYEEQSLTPLHLTLFLKKKKQL